MIPVNNSPDLRFVDSSRGSVMLSHFHGWLRNLSFLCLPPILFVWLVVVALVVAVLLPVSVLQMRCTKCVWKSHSLIYFYRVDIFKSISAAHSLKILPKFSSEWQFNLLNLAIFVERN